MKYHIITFGCQLNVSDSERIATILENANYEKTSKIEWADLVVVNMCSVRQSAVDRVYGKIEYFSKLKAKKLNIKTVLTGCILKKDKNRFAKKFDLVLQKNALFKLPEALNSKYPVLTNKNYLEIKPKYQKGFSALIPISNGCNNFCSYCVVPYTRGALNCRSHKEILKEIKEVIQKGFREIWLLGQNVNDYHSPTNSSINFPKLLRMVNNVPGNFWIRFTSSHPKDFSDELIKTMANCKKVTQYINIPVQSGNNEVLKKMNRFYAIGDYKNLIKKIREAIPNVCISTDVIVGFPGETKEQFKNTEKLFKEIKFDMAYIAEYSPRPQTAASKMENNVPKKEKEKRRRIITEVLKETALENNKKYMGKTVNVLVGGSRIKNKESSMLFGRTKAYKMVEFKLPITFNLQPTKIIGEFFKVKITDTLPWSLKGKTV